MKSRWITSESEPKKYHKDISKKNVVSLQPRIDAIRSHMSEQIADLEGYACESMPISHHNLHNVDCVLFAGCPSYTYIQDQSQSLDRKSDQVTRVSKILLERLSNQLKTVSDLGDIVVILSPAVPVLKNIRSLLIQFMPECYQELCYICELIEVVLVDAAQLGGYTINFQTANESAIQWISEVVSKDYETNESAQ